MKVVLLMYAEAQNELNNGPSAEATNALRRVRTRAFGGNANLVGTIPSDHDGFLSAIIEERKLELAFEGLRKGDLARWGVTYDLLTETKEKFLDLANREGAYDAVPRYAAYRKEKAQLSDPVNEVVPVYTYMTEPDAAEKAKITAEGLTLINLNGEAPTEETGNTGIVMKYLVDGNKPHEWVTTYNSGLTKNKSELYPFNQTIIDQNPALADQQHPSF